MSGHSTMVYSLVRRNPRRVLGFRFYKYDSEEYGYLDPTIVSSKYFDKNFEDYTHVETKDIPTPHFDSIMTYQKFEEEV